MIKAIFGRTKRSEPECPNEASITPRFENRVKFKEDVSLLERMALSTRMKTKHYGYVPVILFSDTIEFQRSKLLAPADITVSAFMIKLRDYCILRPNEALFILINNKTASGSMSINELYERRKDPDGFLYIFVTKENVFG